LAITHKIIDKSGAWFSYGETRLGQGRENVRQFLEQHTDLTREIEAKLRKLLGLIKEPRAAAEAKGDGKDAPRAAEAKDPSKPPAPKDAPPRDVPKPRGHAPAARP